MNLKNNKSKGLGRGLNAIFDTEDITLKNQTPMFKSGTVSEIKLSEIEPNPTQPRQNFDQESIEELSESIKSLGLIQPLTLRKKSDGGYIIISGERRYRASKLIGLESVPAYVREVDDNTMLEMALVENIQREDLNPMEVAYTLSRLIDECGITQEQLAERVGKKRSTVSNYLRLAKQPAHLHLSLAEGIITMGHAKALMGIDDEEKQLEALKRVVKEEMTVRQTEQFVKSLLENKNVAVEQHPVEEIEYPEVYTKLVDRLEGIFSSNISIKRGKKGESKIVIGLKNDSEIEEILRKFETLNN